MIVKYNSLNRLEKPKITLCNPGSVYENGTVSSVVGILIDHEAEEILFNFNATSELNLRVRCIPRENKDENDHILKLFKAIQNRRLLFLDDIGFFAITRVDDGFSDGGSYKDIQARSIDSEIQQKKVPYIENGTYQFFTTETDSNKGILNIITDSLPLWKVGFVDENVKQKWRTFEDVDFSLNCLSFLLNNVQEAYDCIILFNIVNRTISVYDQNNYVKETDVFITKDNLINSLNVTEDADSLYTSINVLGAGDIGISAINPLGTNTIYNFNHYLNWMSEPLRTKVVSWQDNVESVREEYYDTNLQYYTMLAERSDLQSEIRRLEIQITMYQRCRDNIVAESSTRVVDSYNRTIVENGGTPIEIQGEIQETLNEIDGLIIGREGDLDIVQNNLLSLEDNIVSLQVAIDRIRKDIAISEQFTEEEYSELSHFIFEGEYRDEYVLITNIMSYEEQFSQMKILYDRAIEQLKKVSKPTQEFNIDVDNFIFIKEFEHLSEQLETGCLINVEIEDGDIALLFLTNITINYDDHSLKMSFGNRYNKFDSKSLFENVLGGISKSANTLHYIKDTVTPIKSGEFNAMKDALQTSRDLTMGKAFSSGKEEVILDESGYTGKQMLDSGVYDPRQLKIVSKNIVFTDDAWESSKVAIGELSFGEDGESSYGVNAEMLIGDLIMGNNLRIVDNNGNDLLTVVDGKINAQVDAVDGRVSSLEQTANNIDIRIQAIEDADDEITSVTTTTGYTFNEDGLSISRSGEEIRNLLDNTGMYITRSGEEILTANNEGVTALNLTANQFFIIGKNSRFEDYSDGEDTKRTACFYIGN